MSPVTLQTERLKLVPHSPQNILALVAGTEAYEQSFGLPPAAGLCEFVAGAEVAPEWLLKLRSASTTDPWTHGFAMVPKAGGEVIGLAGFKGPPGSDAMVEIAYGVVPAYQGKGYATEAAQLLVVFAFDSGWVRTVRAHTLPERNASGRVLSKCGFTWLDEVEDPLDGRIWRWEFRLNPPAPAPDAVSQPERSAGNG